MQLFLEGIEIQQTPRVADIFAQISCYVCQGPSSGIHFGKIFIKSEDFFSIVSVYSRSGAITCEGCKVSPIRITMRLAETDFYIGILSAKHKRKSTKSL